MKTISLYHTEGCHLCELAQAVFAEINAADIYQLCDIAGSENLVEQYGLRIPVVYARQSDQCLDWPFDTEQLQEFLKHA